MIGNVSSRYSVSDTTPQDSDAQPQATQLRAAQGASENTAGIQFGSSDPIQAFVGDLSSQMNTLQADADKLEKDMQGTQSSLQEQLAQLLKNLAGSSNDSSTTTTSQADTPAANAGNAGDVAAPAQGASGAAPAQGSCGAAAPVAAPAGAEPATAGPAADPVPAASDAGKFLDDSKYSSPDALKKWAPMVANLPPDQQLQAEKELNRPIAAAQMAQEKGANGAQAIAFIKSNPALSTAIDTAAHGGKADGIISGHDLSAFISRSTAAAVGADKTLEDYQKANPNADPQSLQMVISASLLSANSLLTAAADPQHVKGASGETNVRGESSSAGLEALQNSNPGLSSALRQSAKTFQQPGFFSLLDQGGESRRKLATESKDGLFDSRNINGWIKNQAPKNGGDFASMLNDAATVNAVSCTDISKLGSDVFANPNNYTGAQKAAVLVKLQQTELTVSAGSDLRKTGDTQAALNEKIGQLQSDPQVQAYMAQAVPAQEQQLVASDPALKKAVYDQMQSVNSGQALRSDMSTADKNTKAGAIPDYSSAAAGLTSQLQLQRDLLGPDAKVPTAQQVVSNQPDLSNTLQNAYKASFTEGGELTQLLGQKKADVGQALQTFHANKSAYEDLLPDQFVNQQQAQFQQSIGDALTGSKAGRSFLGKAANGDGTAQATLSETATDKAQDVQSDYDNVKDGFKGARVGINAAAQATGKEAGLGLGRLATGAAVRVGVTAGVEAVGAAASAIGAAAGPVGWAVDALVGIGLGIAAIIEAVRKQRDRKNFDKNVDPTLNQFGIPKPH